LLAVVKREDFVPGAYKALAFVDTEVPLPNGQCMLAPKVEARLLQELDVRKHERVLEIGAGSGYMAALLGHKAQQAITMEIDPQLAEMARANLRRASVMKCSAGQRLAGPYSAPGQRIATGRCVARPSTRIASAALAASGTSTGAAAVGTSSPGCAASATNRSTRRGSALLSRRRASVSRIPRASRT